MGPVHTGTGPKSKQVTTPKRKCSHCGVESETFEPNCPNCGRSYGMSRKATIAIIAASAIGAILLIGGCAAFFVGVIDEIEDSTITRSEFDSVELGTTRAEVEDRLGDPETVGEFVGGECIYYNEAGNDDLDDPYLELCFAGGVLESKFAQPD